MDYENTDSGRRQGFAGDNGSFVGNGALCGFASTRLSDCFVEDRRL